MLGLNLWYLKKHNRNLKCIDQFNESHFWFFPVVHFCFQRCLGEWFWYFLLSWSVFQLVLSMSNISWVTLFWLDFFLLIIFFNVLFFWIFSPPGNGVVGSLWQALLGKQNGFFLKCDSLIAIPLLWIILSTVSLITSIDTLWFFCKVKRILSFCFQFHLWKSSTLLIFSSFW